MNLQTQPAHHTVCKGEINLLARNYFPNEDRRTFELEVVHGPKYQPDCNSCQAGVTYIKQAFEYLKGGTVVWNENIVEQSKTEVSVAIGPYNRILTSGSHKICIVPVEPLLGNLIQWFHKQFQGQLELAHANILTMRCEQESFSLNLGY